MTPASTPTGPAATPRSARDVLRDVFGFAEYRPDQEEIVDHLVAGGDAFVLMPTGGGKSLCYQLPAIVRPGTGVVVSPLISLMKDQVDALRAAGVSAAAYNSSLEAGEARSVLRALHAGELDLLYVAPETLMTEGFLERLRGLADGADGDPGEAGVALFAIDEAHCVSQWGHDFRPEYVQLGQLRELFPGVPIMACTATADPETRDDVRERLGLSDAAVYVTGFDRPNIRYTVVEKREPLHQLLQFLAAHEGESGIVYCLSRKRTEEVADKLRTHGVNAAAYHAGLPADERRRVQDAFARDEVHIVVATVAFGMGIDKSDVRFVVHHDLPKTVESYYQETGRSGRDGLPAEALLLFGLGDAAVVRSLIEGGGRGRSGSAATRRSRATRSACASRPTSSTPWSATPTGSAAGARRSSATSASPTRRRAATATSASSRPRPSTPPSRRAWRSAACTGCGSATGSATASATSSTSCAAQRTRRSSPAATTPSAPTASAPSSAATTGRASSASSSTAATWSRTSRATRRCGSPRPRGRSCAATRPSSWPSPGSASPPRSSGCAPPAPGGRRSSPGCRSTKSLFEALRALRKRLADEQNVPAYVVFSDATLAEMAARHPGTNAELLEVNGVGQTKLERYGDAFLAEIAERA